MNAKQRKQKRDVARMREELVAARSYESRIASLENELAMCRTFGRGVTGQLAEVKAELVEARAELVRLRAEAVNSDSVIDDMDRELADVRARAGRLDVRVGELTGERDALEAKWARYEDPKSLRKKLKERTETIELLRREVKRSKRLLEEVLGDAEYEKKEVVRVSLSSGTGTSLESLED